MAQVEQSIKDYGRKIGLVRTPREYKVTPTPILWQSENRKLIDQAFTALQSGLVAVPLLAGMDKFFEIIGDWTAYLAPVFPQMFGTTPQFFIHMVGAVEIVIALGIALMPRFFSFILLAWLGAIISNLLMLGGHLDIVLRDCGLAAAAYALGRLSQLKEEVPVVMSEEVTDFSTPELAN